MVDSGTFHNVPFIARIYTNLVLFNQLLMSEAKLLKYLRKDYIQPSGNKTITPVVLSDSKGFCLQKKSHERSRTKYIVVVRKRYRPDQSA